MGNYDFKNGANYRHNSNPNQDNRVYIEKKGGRGGKIAIITMLSLLIVLVIVLLAVILLKYNSQLSAVEETTQTMYIDNDENIALWESAKTSSSQIDTIIMGDAVEFIEYAENGFAKVRYDGKEGFVESKFLSTTEPYIWTYEDREVEDFVENALYAFVNSINKDDVSILTVYLSGEARNDAYTVHDQVTKVTNNEVVLAVKCYNVTRISKTQATVVRESTIRVYRHNGTVKDVTEKYLSTVENTGDGMHIIKYEAIE